jgi:hypothetical protein
MGEFYDYYGDYSCSDFKGSTLCSFFNFMINCFEQKYFELFKEKHKGDISLLKKSWDELVKCTIEWPSISKQEIKVVERMKNYKEVADHIGITFDN